MIPPSWTRIEQCRGCGGAALDPILSFGETPISDRLREKPNSVDPAPMIPLELVFCHGCSLLQLSVNVDPDHLYDAEYPYYSSVSPALSRHFADMADAVAERYGIGEGARVIEAACNDGCLLKNFAQKGASVTGFDPASGPAMAARADGLDVEIAFFNEAAATRYVATNGRADLFLATNVLAHVPDLQGFVRAISAVLQPTGVAVIEVPYLVDLVENKEFDTIYHQHLCYFSVSSLSAAFATAGLVIETAERVAAQGGSLRLHVRFASTPGKSVRDLLRAERAMGQDTADFAAQIANAATQVREALVEKLCSLKNQNRAIAGYGAAAKATSLLSWCGLDADTLPVIADLNAVKQGKFMPGTDIQIVSVDQVLSENPDAIVIFAWNLADEIQDQLRMAGYNNELLVPVPNLVSLV